MTSGAVTADGRPCLLADGSQMPMLGLGLWQAPNGPERVNAGRWALDLGHRHTDTPQAYAIPGMRLRGPGSPSRKTSGYG